MDKAYKRERIRPMKIHKSKVDKWYLALVFGIAAMPFGLGAAFGGVTWLGVLICGLIAAFMLWLPVATKYVVTAEELVIHGGVIKLRIPRQAITSITDTSSLVSSPAFSLDRLEVKYGEDKIVLISPKDKAGFLGDINWPEAA